MRHTARYADRLSDLESIDPSYDCVTLCKLQFANNIQAYTGSTRWNSSLEQWHSPDTAKKAMVSLLVSSDEYCLGSLHRRVARV